MRKFFHKIACNLFSFADKEEYHAVIERVRELENEHYKITESLIDKETEIKRLSNELISLETEIKSSMVLISELKNIIKEFEEESKKGHTLKLTIEENPDVTVYLNGEPVSDMKHFNINDAFEISIGTKHKAEK